MTLLEALQMKGYSREEAFEEIQNMKQQVLEGEEDPEELLYQVGLEPDYIFDILDA